MVTVEPAKPTAKTILRPAFNPPLGERDNGLGFSSQMSEPRAESFVPRDDLQTMNKTVRPHYEDARMHLAVYKGNCLQILDQLLVGAPEGRFDMVFADPPYFLSNGGITCSNGKMVKVHKGDWDKSQGTELDHTFTKEWLGKCRSLLKPNGTIWVSGTQHVIFSVGFAMQEYGFKILNHITWEKPNPPPNLSCRYFTHSTESVIWASKNQQSKHVFNYADMRQANLGKQMKSVWRIQAPGKSEKRHGKHPTQKPVTLLERCILASTNPGDSVLDPFMGSGTTGVACLNTGRAFTGIEVDGSHVELAIKRLLEFRSHRTAPA